MVRRILAAAFVSSVLLSAPAAAQEARLEAQDLSSCALEPSRRLETSTSLTHPRGASGEWSDVLGRILERG